MLTIHRETADGTPVANAVFTIASQWDSNTPLLICKTDANGDAAVPLEHTIADNNQHWYAPRFQSLNDSQSLYYLLTGAVPADTSAAPEVKFNMKCNLLRHYNHNFRLIATQTKSPYTVCK